jgi:pimeloyl-ACP methyl ester carboxylesterase
MAAFLSGDYRLVAIDLLGHGDSDKPKQVSYKISAQMERLHSVIKAIDLPAFHMIGNSMGGHIAGMYAARHPEGVLSVTLLNNGGILSPVIADAWQATAAGEPNPLIIRSVDDIDRFLDYVMVEKPFMTQSIKEHFAKLSMAKQELNDYIFDFLRDENFEDLALELPKITAPVQIIWGEDDRILHVSSIDVMKPLLQNETIVILPNTGHGPMMERPQKTAEALDSFIKNL